MDLDTIKAQAAIEHERLVTRTLRSLTKVQRMYVRDGSIHGDCSMRTVRALQDQAMFYLKITSPNGRCGFMVLTPLGESVQARLKALEDRGAVVPRDAQTPAKQSGMNP